MVIAVSNTITHNSMCKKKSDLREQELQNVILKSMEKLGLDSNEMKWNESGQLELQQPNSLKLHSLMLKVEELGLNLKMTKQTLIEIC